MSFSMAHLFTKAGESDTLIEKEGSIDMESIKNYDTVSVQEKWNILATVANLYYNSELTQNEIAARLFTSRSKVSRMLKEAREYGIVEIHIREPWERNLAYEAQIMTEFHLKSVRVIKVKEVDERTGIQRMAEAASYYLESVVKQNMVVGISWGNTLYRIVKCISANNRKNIPITVVPIMGAANINSPEKDATDLAKDLASAYGGRYQYVYAPLFVKSKELKESLMQEENIRDVVDLARNADVILTSVGSIVHKSWNHYLSEKTLKILEAGGAVGHIGGHFYDIQGKELTTSLAERMIGIDLADIQRCKEVVCVAYGEGKAEAVMGAVRGGWVDNLIIDESCAQLLFTL